MNKNKVVFKQIRFSGQKSVSRNYYQQGHYLDYITRNNANMPDGTTHLINLNTLEMYSPEEFLELKEKFKNLDDNRLVWDTVVSLDSDFAKQNGIGTVKTFAQAIQKSLEKLFEANKTDMDKYVIFGAMHHNTDHPHMHIGFFEKEPMYINENNNPQFRKNGYFGGDNVEKFKEFGSNVEKFIENDILYKSLRDYRKKLCESAMQKFKNENIDDFSRLVSYFVENKIHTFQFNKLNDKAQEQVMNVVDSLIKNDEELNKNYGDLKQTLLDIYELHQKRNDAYKLEDKNSDDLDNWFKLESEDVDVRVANSVLKTIKKDVLNEFDNQKSNESSDGHGTLDDGSENNKTELKEVLGQQIVKMVGSVIENDVNHRLNKAKFNKIQHTKNGVVTTKPIKNSFNYSKLNLDKLRAERELKYFLKKAMQKTLNDALNVYEKMEEELFEKSKAKSYER